jgi:hypothetical protein
MPFVNNDGLISSFPVFMLFIALVGLLVQLLWQSRTETRDTEAVQQEAMFYCAGTESADLSPKAEPQEQRVSSYIPLQAGYRSKRQGLTYICFHAIL